jgi:hypothetical protein
MFRHGLFEGPLELYESPKKMVACSDNYCSADTGDFDCIRGQFCIGTVYIYFILT